MCSPVSVTCFRSECQQQGAHVILHAFVQPSHSEGVFVCREDGTKSERLYKVYGRESLGSDSPWQYPTNSLHRFFKVTVELP